AGHVAEHRVAPADRPGDRLRVRVEEELRGIEAMPVRRRVRAVDAIAVELPRTDVRQARVPHELVLLDERNARLLGRVVGREEADLDARRVLGEDREVDTLAIPARAEGVGPSGKD